LHEGTGPFFRVVTIVPAASTAQKLTDLKGAIVAFGDRASGAIWVVRYQLLLAGFIPGQDYIIRSMGDNTNVARAVTEGLVYAGSMSQPIFNRLIKEGKIDPKSVRVIAESPDIPAYMWTFREGLDPAFKEEVRKVIFEVNDPETLKVYRALSFVPSDEADLGQARKWIVATEAAMPGTVPKAK
jgi:phosphonate transport system substrate-binding protein